MKLGDMHHAAVAAEEIGGEADAREVAHRLRWMQPSPGGGVSGLCDVSRAETALIAAAEHGLIKAAA